MTQEAWAKAVKIELSMRDMTIKDLADLSKYSYSSIRKALCGERNHEHVAEDINRVLGIGKEH